MDKEQMMMQAVANLLKSGENQQKTIEVITNKISQLTAGITAISQRAQSMDQMVMGLLPIVMELAKGHPKEKEFRKWSDDIHAESFRATLKAMSALAPHLSKEEEKVFQSLMEVDIMQEDGMDILMEKFGVSKEDLVAQGLLREQAECGKSAPSSEDVMIEGYLVQGDSRATAGCDCGWCNAVRSVHGKQDEVSIPMPAQQTKH